jgi:DNA-nicking Smr family endonuclease
MSRRDESGSFNSPFRGLSKLVGPRPAPAAAEPSKPRRAARPAGRSGASPDDTDEAALFRDATRGVVPIAPSPPRVPAERRPEPPIAPALREDDEALAELADLVSGASEIDVSDTDEHVEGIVVGADPRLVRRLRSGEFAHQAHIDLHGMTLDEARRAVREFVLRSMAAGRRCVLIVHGRGLNSRDQRPVLKDGVKQWLSRGELSRRVLAFSTARPYDGGTGATYVLLRRERRGKKPFRTLSGAKS